MPLRIPLAIGVNCLASAAMTRVAQQPSSFIALQARLPRRLDLRPEDVTAEAAHAA